ncbi:S-layer homology domain-containing protein [Lawsonibacter sp. OA9]|uniref:S-layer homology domain-containing protein n=2 Tax=Clostridia TaxID=186801 RepID=UPI001F051BF4|nr:S-layer homology domain-containing protein [Lawsonibacter sp. OA9]MCH1978512.1 S-layer homology domain-containing protein [Lawsonibacter sp. OA9]
MRNLKRALSLALASVMVMGLMVVGSGASYVDVSSKNNQEAIEVLQAVGVMTGDENGKFNPDANVTRNEMAVIMSNMLDYKVSNYAGTAPFTDVPAWAEPYVAACWTHGIISGYDAKTFGGSDSVTAAQAALMMLKALGYFQYQSDFGDDWQLSTIRQANQIDLYNDVDVAAIEAMTRNDVAQLALNTLEATQVIVGREPGKVVTPDGTTVYLGSAEYSDLYKSGNRYNAINGKKDDDSKKYSAELGEDLFAGELKKKADDHDDFGRPAVIWSYEGDEIGKYAGEEPVMTYVKDFDKDEVKDLEKDGYDFDGATIYVNGSDETGLDSVADLAARKYKGTVIELYAAEDDDKKIDRIVLLQGYLAQVTDMDDEDVTMDVYNPWLNNDDEAVSFTVEDNSKDDDDWFDRLSKRYDVDDYFVIFIEAADVNDDNDVLAVSDVETVSGTVKTVKITDDMENGYNGSFTLDGTKYTLASGYNNVEINAGDEYDFFLDENGFVIGAKAANDEVNVDDYIFVKEVGESGFDNIAKALFMDGTSKTITVSELDNDDDFTWDKSEDAKKFYTFKEKKNGEYELKLVDDQNKAESATVDNVAKPISGVTKTGNSSTLFIAKDKVYTGVKNAPEVEAGNVYYIFDGGRLVVVYSENEGSASTSADELVYVLSDNYAVGLDEDDEEYYEYDVFMDGEKTTLLTRKDDLEVGLYQIKSYEDDLYAEFEKNVDGDLVKTEESVSTVDYEDGTLTLDDESYLLADDVKVYTIDGTTVKSIGAGSIENRVTKDGFDNVTLIQLDEDDNEFVIVYLTK